MPTSQDIIQATDENTLALQALISQVSDVTISIKGTRDNLALLTTAVKDATAQAKRNADSSSNLAKSLNRITFMLVIVGLLQVVVTLIITWHR